MVAYLSDVVLHNTVASVCLVDPDFTLGSHVMESLLGVDASFEWSRPGGGVDGRSLLFRVCQVLPVDQESDGVFGLWVTAHRCGNTSGGGGGDFCGLVSALDHPAVDLIEVSNYTDHETTAG